MNWEDQDIDDLFRNSGTGNIPPFDDAHWAEMEAMLPDDGKGVDIVFINAEAAKPVPAYKDAYWKEMQAMLPQRKRRVAAIWWYGAAGVLMLLFGFGTIHYYTKSSVRENTSDLTIQQSGANETGESVKPLSGNAEQDIPVNAQSDENNTASDMPPGVDFRAATVNDVSCCDQPSDEELRQLQPEELKDNVDLLAKNETGVSYNMARMPFAGIVMTPDRNNFYLQLGAGLGQSFIRNSPGSDMVHFYSLGGGIQQRVGSMYMSFGLNGRVDFIYNLNNQVVSPQGMVRSDLRQLYAIETPLVLAFAKGKNRIGGILTPGFQMGYTGTYTTYDIEQNVTRSGKTSGKMPQTRTLTMEVGAVYMRTFSDKWSGGCIIATDLIGPSGEKTYSGQNRLLPVNGSLLVRRSL